ncbi:MAG: SBBP repeat-containing protein [Candidatus Aminicenantes bacterium]|nr:SBBP repeat-containing protein [Candidatus Aminicenantes bacterium]
MKKIIFLCLVLALFMIVNFAANSGKIQNQALPLTIQGIDNAPVGIPLYFIPNQGQVHEKAKFYANTPRYILWVTEEGLTFDSLPGTGVEDKVKPREREVSRLIFLGANPNPGIIPVELTPHQVNYYQGNNPAQWRTGIQTSKAVLYKGIYPGIDLKIYGKENQVEYDWIIKPGGHPGDICFQYRDAKATHLDNNGNLVIKTALGELVHQKPISYQLVKGEKRNIQSRFKCIKKNTYTFTVSDYNRAYELVIDPVVTLEYSTYLGGSSDEYYASGAVDNTGHIYMTGYTHSVDFPTRNAYQSSKLNGYDAFLTKFTADGSGLVFSTYVGGNNDDKGTRIVVSSTGDIYISGYTNSTNFPAVNPLAGDYDTFCCRFDADGNFLGGRLVGGSGTDLNNAIAINKSNHVYLTGWTSSLNYPLKNPYQNILQGNHHDIYICKFDPGLTEIEYSTYLGGKGGDSGGAELVVDDFDYIYLQGVTSSSNLPLKNAWQKTYAGGLYDTYLCKIKPDGSDLVFSTYLGGSGTDYGHGIAVDENGGIIVGGDTHSSDFPVKSPYQGTKRGNPDSYVSKFSPDGSELIYSTLLGGSNSNCYGFMTADRAGYVYISGSTNSPDFPTVNPYQSSLAGGLDAFLSILDKDGSKLLYSTYFGGTGADHIANIFLDLNGNIYVAGATYSSNFPVKKPYQNAFKGIIDGFLFRFSFTPDSKVLTVQSVADSAVPITASPLDNNGKGNGYTDFTRTYPQDSVVTLSAPLTFNNKNFYRWLIDGEQQFQDTIEIKMDDNHTVVVEYRAQPIAFLTVRSSPVTGIPITVNPFDNNGQANGNTNFTRVYTRGTVVNLTAPAAFLDKIFDKWSGTGVNQTGRTLKITLNTTRTVKALYKDLPTGTLIIKSTPVSGVPIIVSPTDKNNISDGNTEFTRNYSPGTEVTLIAPELSNGRSFYKWTLDGKDYNDRIARVTISNSNTALVVYQKKAEIVVSRDIFNFGYNSSGAVTGPQSFFISNNGESPLNWSINDNVSWITCSPVKGIGSEEVTITVNGAGLPVGTHNGEITISAPDAVNSPQKVYVTLIVNEPGIRVPFGFFETPLDGATLSGSVPVTGWALDDIEVEKVQIYRQEGTGLVYVGDAVFVEGARPDVETAYPNYPRCYRAGWGYMILTHFLPGGGNGGFTFQAIAEDREGNQVALGSKTIYCDNAHSCRPFGAIDTPAQGGTASGSLYRNQGWVLTPPTNEIPKDGHTILVWIDGFNRGTPVYNIYRDDVAALFPGYANSNGAMGYFDFDTAGYKNGVHTIAWTAMDDAGNTDGFGSRYFTIRNSADNKTNMGGTLSSADGNCHEISISAEEIARIPVDNQEPISIKKGYIKNSALQEVYPDENGMINIELKELERIEVHFQPPRDIFEGDREKANNYIGYHIINERLRPLPVGSTLDGKRGIFYWQPGPGFIGKYRLVFMEKMETGLLNQKEVGVTIIPKTDR